jgi:hypothetical protein
MINRIIKIVLVAILLSACALSFMSCAPSAAQTQEEAGKGEKIESKKKRAAKAAKAEEASEAGEASEEAAAQDSSQPDYGITPWVILTLLIVAVIFFTLIRMGNLYGYPSRRKDILPSTEPRYHNVKGRMVFLSEVHASRRAVESEGMLRQKSRILSRLKLE